MTPTYPESDPLAALAADPVLADLDARLPRATFMRALGLARAETYHSRLLAYILDSRHTKASTALAGRLLDYAADSIEEEHAPLAIRLRAAAGSIESVRSRAERWNIDIVSDIRSEHGRILLGIENKIDAGEQDRQVERY